MAIALLSNHPNVEPVLLSTVENNADAADRRLNTLRAVCEFLNIKPLLHLTPGHSFHENVYPIDLPTPSTRARTLSDASVGVATDPCDVQPVHPDEWLVKKGDDLEQLLSYAPDGSWLVILRPFPDLMQFKNPGILHKFKTFMYGSYNLRCTASVQGSAATEAFINSAFQQLLYFETFLTYWLSATQQDRTTATPLSCPQTFAEMEQCKSQRPGSAFGNMAQMMRMASKMWDASLAARVQQTVSELSVISDPDQRTITRLQRNQLCLDQLNETLSDPVAFQFVMADAGLATLMMDVENHLKLQPTSRLTIDPQTFYVTWHTVPDDESENITAADLFRRKEKPKHTIHVPVKSPMAAYDQAMTHILRMLPHDHFMN